MNNEERARIVRQMTQQAIQCALDSRWEEAVTTNRELMKIVQRNPETMNRLGKALSELGRYSEAKKSYSESLQINPDNIIAKKNLDRLSLLGEDAAPGTHGKEQRIDPRLFIEEIGKTGLTELVATAPAAVLARQNPGDQVQLHVDGHTLQVRNARGETIGQVEPVLANRLIKLIQGGNQYIAGITEITKRHVRIIIRETFQHSTQLGKVSFAAMSAASMPRADTRDTLLRRDRDDDNDDDDDDTDDSDDFDDDDSDDDAAESADEPEERE